MNTQNSTLTGNAAKMFFNLAFLEIEQRPQIENTFYLKQERGGYWKEGEGQKAFDNRGNELFIEEFSDKAEAIKYANGIMATTKSGFEI